VSILISIIVEVREKKKRMIDIGRERKIIFDDVDAVRGYEELTLVTIDHDFDKTGYHNVVYFYYYKSSFFLNNGQIKPDEKGK